MNDQMLARMLLLMSATGYRVTLQPLSMSTLRINVEDLQLRSLPVVTADVSFSPGTAADDYTRQMVCALHNAYSGLVNARNQEPNDTPTS